MTDVDGVKLLNVTAPFYTASGGEKSSLIASESALIWREREIERGREMY